jgi:hypothetical protein
MSGYTIDFRVGIVGFGSTEHIIHSWLHITMPDVSISRSNPRRVNDGD